MYKVDKEKKKIPEEYDRRRKFTSDKKKKCIELYESGVSIRRIAIELNISKRSVQFFLFPERLEQCKLRQDERGGWKIYYNKEYNTKKVKATRFYRKELDEKGLLTN